MLKGMSVQWLNSQNRWGLVHVFVHWSVAVSIAAVFALGLWMVELDYYSEWYQTAPDLHRSIGLLLLVLMFARLVWRLLQPVPRPPADQRVAETRIAHLAHWLLYLLVAGVIVSGYLISTADGRPIDVFGWFELPALFTGIDDQEELMGEWHEIAAWTLAALVALHAAAALKHHFCDRDATLTRMLGLSTTEENH